MPGKDRPAEGRLWIGRLRVHDEFIRTWDLDENVTALFFIGDDFADVGGGEAVSAKMKTEPYLYWPVLESEIRVNKNLQQNPVYELDKTTSKN